MCALFGSICLLESPHLSFPNVCVPHVLKVIHQPPTLLNVNVNGVDGHYSYYDVRDRLTNARS